MLVRFGLKSDQLRCASVKPVPTSNSRPDQRERIGWQHGHRHRTCQTGGGGPAPACKSSSRRCLQKQAGGTHIDRGCAESARGPIRAPPIAAPPSGHLPSPLRQSEGPQRHRAPIGTPILPLRGICSCSAPRQPWFLPLPSEWPTTLASASTNVFTLSSELERRRSYRLPGSRLGHKRTPTLATQRRLEQIGKARRFEALGQCTT